MVVVGATSRIAQETVRRFAEKGSSFYLVARDEQKLQSVATDARSRCQGNVYTKCSDLGELSQHRGIIEDAVAKLPSLDVVLIAHGILGVQSNFESDYEKAEELLRVNFLSTVSLLTLLANVMNERKHGTIAVISSVAGDRGRMSNYVYGTSKGAISIYLEGVRNRLYRSGVHVLTIKPGMVDTPMTSHIRKGLLFANPATVGRDIHRAILKKKDVLYTPWYWLYIMAIIKAIPEPIFKRMKL